jgi:F420-non-reducing hydrogenase small subunit
MKSIATLSLASDAGCHVAIVSLHKELLRLFKDLKLVFSPILVDAKNVPEDIDVVLVEGSVRTIHDEDVLREARAKSKTLIALGSCACFSGVQSICNLLNKNDLLRYVYEETESTIEGLIPREGVPEPLPYVMAISEVVPVDFKIPGCPPEPEEVFQFLKAILEGKKPELPRKSVCNECDKKKTGNLVHSLKRLHERPEDPERCLLEQGYLCMGPATRAGCKAKCLKFNVPCDGCRGPPEETYDQGISMLDALLTLAPERLNGYNLKTHSAIFHRYTFSSSPIMRLVKLMKK